MAAERSVRVAIDHLVLVARERGATLGPLTAAFGAPVWASADAEAGTRSDFFVLGGPLLELLTADGDGPTADRLRELLASEGEGVMSIAYRSSDLAAASARLVHAGVAPSAVGEGRSTDLPTGRTRRWRRLRLPSETTPGLRHFTIEPIDLPPARAGGPALRGIRLATPAPELLRAIAGAHADPDGVAIDIEALPQGALSRITELAIAGAADLPPRIVGVAIAAI